MGCEVGHWPAEGKESKGGVNKQTNKNLRCGCTKAARPKRPKTPGSSPISLLIGKGNTTKIAKGPTQNQQLHTLSGVQAIGDQTLACTSISSSKSDASSDSESNRSRCVWRGNSRPIQRIRYRVLVQSVYHWSTDQGSSATAL